MLALQGFRYKDFAILDIMV